FRPAGGTKPGFKSCASGERRTYRGEGGGRQGFDRPRPLPASARRAVHGRLSQPWSASRHHINGVFTTDISGIAGFRRLRRISDEPAPVFALFAGYYWGNDTPDARNPRTHPR